MATTTTTDPTAVTTTDPTATTSTTNPTATSTTTNGTPAAINPNTTGAYDPSTYGVNAGSDTVQGRLTGLLNTPSDYMTSAQTSGLQKANSLGLLNSSMAVGAAQNAAIQAALPIAQQDADWTNKNRLQADTLANDRLEKQYEQQNLAFSQYLKAMGDVNMQDIPEEAKNLAAQRLWDAFTANSQIASTLAGANISNGQISWSSDTGTNPSASGTASATPSGTTSYPVTTSNGAPGTSVTGTSGAAPGALGSAPQTAASSPTGVDSNVQLGQMYNGNGTFAGAVTPTGQLSYQGWIQKFGPYQPAQVNNFLTSQATLQSKYASSIGTPTPYNQLSLVTAIDGTKFTNQAAATAYNNDLSYYAKQNGIDISTFPPFHPQTDTTSAAAPSLYSY